jgi:hypothetical protein
VPTEALRTGITMHLLAEDLGPRQEQAIAEFPDLLHERGEV